MDTSAISALGADITAAMTQQFAAEAATSQPAAPVAVPGAQPQVAPPVAVQPPVPQAPVPAQSPSLQPAPAEAVPTQAQQEAAVAGQLNDQALYQVPQSDGTTVMLSGKEIREGVLRQGDYTRKTQELARQRQEVERVMPTLQQLQQRQAALDADLNNPQAVANYLVQKFGPQVAQQYLQQLVQAQGPVGAPQPASNPDEVASQGYVAQHAQTLSQQIAQQQAQLGQLHQQLQQEAQLREQATAQAQRQAVNQIQVMQERQAINAAIPGILAANPLITSVPNHVELLRFEVLKNYQPSSVQEAIQCFQIEAQKLSANIEAGWNARQKTQLVQTQQAQLQANGLATVGGTPLTAQPQGPRLFIGQDGRLDKQAQTAGVLEFMRQAQAQQG